MKTLFITTVVLLCLISMFSCKSANPFQEDVEMLFQKGDWEFKLIGVRGDGWPYREDKREDTFVIRVESSEIVVDPRIEIDANSWVRVLRHNGKVPNDGENHTLVAQGHGLFTFIRKNGERKFETSVNYYDFDQVDRFRSPGLHHGIRLNGRHNGVNAQGEGTLIIDSAVYATYYSVSFTARKL